MTLAAEYQTPKPSVLHRIDARWRVGGLLAWATIGSFTVHLPASIATLIGSILLFLSSGLLTRWLGRRVLALLPFLTLLVVPLVLSDGSNGIWSAILLIVKALAVALPIFVILGTSTTTEVGDFMAALNVPDRLINMILFSERTGTMLAGDFNRVRRAMCIRGFRWQANRRTYATVASAVGAATVRAFDHSQRISQALSCRGFAGEYRTWRVYVSTALDLCFVVLIVLSGVTIVIWDRWLGS